MNIYPNHSYESLPTFDGYSSSQTLTNSIGSNVLLDTSPSTLTYVANEGTKSSSTLVNLLYQKRSSGIGSSEIVQDKPKISTKQTRKSTMKKPIVKRLLTSTSTQVIFSGYLLSPL